MARTLLVVDNLSDWAPYYPSEQLITFEDYLATEQVASDQHVRVINLCRSYCYLSDGYYCSLLAEARGHNVIPSVKVLSDLDRGDLYRLHLEGLSKALSKAVESQDQQTKITLHSYFGTPPKPAFQELTGILFERFSCPVLKITLQHFPAVNKWEISELQAISHHSLDEAAETHFAAALDKFSKKVWCKDRPKKPSRFDLAMLINPEEKMPPSNRGALKKFITAGRQLGIDVELISPQHYARLPEFDGLFIRETTGINHHTYRFSKKAEAEGIMVIDDPTSMLRCTNKIYLADLFRTHRVPAPKTWLLHKDNAVHLDNLVNSTNFPIVIKIPDGSFSRGVVKVQNRQELEVNVAELFKQSALLLAQEFLYTDFDWRIGILNNQALYACRYYMVKNHWQIYRYGGSKVDMGKFDTLPTFEAPKAVLEAALKATQPIGNGLYGVDVKEKDGKGFVIEVNDNPSIDRGVEDLYLGDELYHLIMAEFLRRMENRCKGDK
ncbi:MAG: RimK family protein [Methylobacter sp.]|uniref:RimK family protein n=1 Tax=Candidatus Methylobacter titanis TaxID=3053457 RepID=A0AA43Q624_9GAMM|nr:RimK family protein [Candidatus Methylobacter titanis]